MVLVKFVAFAVFKILCSLVFMRNSSNADNCDVGGISKTVEGDLMFIYDKPSEFVVIFVSNLMFLVVKNVASFT